MSEMRNAGLSLDDELDFYASRLAKSTGVTGTGDNVLSISPSLTTPTFDQPTIADFRNATHTHETNAGGGILSPAAFISSAGAAASLISMFDLAWWEARTEATSYSHGGAVGTITDSSAAAQNWTQSTAGNKPTWKSTGASGAMLPNGHPFVRFDGSDDYLDRAARISANAHTFILVARNYGGGTGYRCRLCTDNHLVFKAMATNAWGYFGNGPEINYGASATSGWNIYVHRVTGTGYNNWDLSANSLMLNSTSAGSSNGKTVATIGWDHANTYDDEDWAAFAIASSALTAAQISAVVAYFANVYGIGT